LVKEGYKETEIGVFPKDWGLTSAKNLMKIETGSRNTEHKSDNGKYLFFVRSQQVEHIDSYHYDCEAVLTAGDGVGTGKVFHYINGKFDAHQRVYVMSQFKDISGRFFYNYFKENFGNEVAKYTAKSSVDSVRRDMIAEMLIPVPSPEEQQKIAEALSDMDNLISSLEKLIEKKKAIKQGAMQELLTGKKRLSGFSGAWKEFCIGKIGEFYGGLSGKTKNDFNCGNAHYITFLNVLSNVKIDTSMLASVNVKETENQNAVKKGDLFFNTSSETPEEVGMCAVLDEEIENTYLNSFCFGFRMKNNEHNPIFLSYYLNSSIGRKIMSTLAQGATRYNLSKNNFAETIIELPTKEEQTAIASILSDMDAEITALEQKLTKCQKLKQGMMQQLLTGKIRLI